MTPHDRLRMSIAAAQYLEALEQDDEATLASLWEAAATDEELFAALRDIHAGLVEEQVEQLNRLNERIAQAAQKHLQADQPPPPPTGPITVAHAAEELLQHPPDHLTAEEYELNHRLRSVGDSFPADLGLSDFIAWAEQRYGPAPRDYWKALRGAAITLELRRGSHAQYQLAARRAPKPEEESK